MEEIKVSEMLQAESINKDDSVMIIQEGVNKKASGSIQTATGTSLSLTSVADTCKVKSESKNLFNNQISTQTKGGVTITKGKDGTLTLNGTTTNNVLITMDIVKLENGKTYTLSGGSEVETQGARIDMRVSEDGALYNTWYIPDNPTRTMTEDVTLYAVLRLQNGVTFNNVVIKPQLEEGSTATSYNPYNTEIIIADGDVSSPTIEAGTIQQANGQNATGSRMRSAGYIDVEPNKEYTLNADGNTAVVFEYKADNTYIHRIPDNWIETPYTFTTTSETAKVRFVTESPNVTQDQITFQEGSQSQEITLTPQEEKLAYTYNTKTGIISDGSVTIEYNTQSRLLNNDDTTAIKEYVDRIAKEKSQEIYSTKETRIGTFMGKPLYRMMTPKISVNSNTMSSTSLVTLGIIDPDIIIINVGKSISHYNTSVVGGAYNNPNYYSGSSDYGNIYIDANKVLHVSNMSGSAREYYVCLEYTKTTD